MKITTHKIKKNLFYSAGEKWWLIGFSMLMAGGILTEPQMITAFLLNGNLSGMWLVWSAGLGLAFGMVFFAHLWRRLPVKTENELLLYRFSGTGAKWLHVFRSLYVGGIVVPLAMSMGFLAFARVLGVLLNIAFVEALGAIFIFMAIGTFFNSLRNRIRMDFIYFLIFLITLMLLFAFLNLRLGSLADIKHVIANSNLNFRLFPQFGTNAFSAFMVFIFVQWWAAGIIDLPSTEGQKLMAAKSSATIGKSIVLPRIFFALFLIIISIFPFYILLIEPSLLHGVNKETAFVLIFKEALIGNEKWLAVVFFSIPFFVLSHNLQNWSGSLLVQNFYKHYIKKESGDAHLRKVGILAMWGVITLATLIAYFSDSVLGITKYFLTITAGVGPVFILRWYWHRVNAWAQLSAMILSLIFPTVYDILYAHTTWYCSFIDSLMNWLHMDYFPLKIIVLSTIVTISWVAVMYATPPTSSIKLKRFASQIKPGGNWPFKRSGNSNFLQRLIIAIILSGNFILIYVILWQLVNELYLIASGLFTGHVFTMLLAYYFLQKVNKGNG